MDDQTLGILISSTRYADVAAKLARAAVCAGKQVRIHILGQGIDVMTQGAFSGLGRQIQIQACMAGARTSIGSGRHPLPDRVSMVSPEALLTSLHNCRRHVVF